MAEKRKRRARRSAAGRSSNGSNGYKGKLVKIGCIAAGIALGKFAKDKLSAPTAAAAGIDGVTSSQIVSGAVAAAGVIGSVMAKNPYVKDIALGMGISGAASVVNSLTGQNFIALGDAGEETILLEPTPEYTEVEGVDGDPMLISGVGDVDGNADPIFAGIGDVDNMILS